MMIRRLKRSASSIRVSRCNDAWDVRLSLNGKSVHRKVGVELAFDARPYGTDLVQELTDEIMRLAERADVSSGRQP
jgi:hypothetical protein